MSRSVPVPFRVIAVLGLLWNLYGLAMFWLNLTISPEAVAALPDAQREITLAMPRWIMLPFAIATIGGVLGMLALLLWLVALGLWLYARRAAARGWLR